MAWLFNWAEQPSFVDYFINASAKALLILMICAALCSLLKRASAATRHFVWTLALAGLLALPLLSFGLPVWEIALLPSEAIKPDAIANDTPAATVNSSIARLLASSAATTVEAIDADKQRSTMSAQSNSAERSEGLNEAQVSAGKPAWLGWVRWSFLIWLAGAILVMGRLWIGTVSIWWIARRGKRITDLGWVNEANDISWQIGLMRRVRMVSTSSISMPVTCGLMSSVILLPAEANEWANERRKVVLLHELAHVKRWDCLTQLLAQVACSIHWFNPLVWLAARQHRIERERACDDQVIDVGTRASDYAGHLLDMARTFRSAKYSSLAAVAIARRSELEGRLLAILDPGLKRRRLNRVAAISLAIIIVCVVLPLSTMRLSAKAQANRVTLGESIGSSPTEEADRAAIPPGSITLQSGRQQAEQPEEQTPPGLIDASAQPEQPLPDAQPDQEGPGSTSPTTQKGNKEVIEALLEAMKDEDSEVRQHALFALFQIGDPAAIPAMIEALKDQSWQVRARAAHAIALKGGRNGLDVLIGALKDPSWQVREQAAWGLGLTGGGRVIEPLIDALRDENSSVREKAAWALGLKGDKRSVEPLMAALKDEASNVRGMAAWALGLKGDARAANALKDALKDSDKGVRQHAAWALGMLLIQRGDGADAEEDREHDSEATPDREGEAVGPVVGGVPAGTPPDVTPRVKLTSAGIGRGAGDGNGNGFGVGIAAGGDAIAIPARTKVKPPSASPKTKNRLK